VLAMTQVRQKEQRRCYCRYCNGQGCGGRCRWCR
jgi:hypothetical protein